MSRLVSAAPVSVIIPSYNRAHLLPRALDSVFSQTLAAKEVIVVDDGSTDHTEKLIRQRYPQVRYLTQANSGVSAARNLGIAHAHHEWLAFLDSDDEWLPQKLQKQLTAFQTENFLLCHSEEIWIRRGKRVNPMKKHAKTGGWIYQHCLPLCAISPSSVLIHRTLFEQVGLFDETLPACEDYDLWLRICARHPVCYIDKALIIKYGGHDDQLSQKHWGMDRFRIRALEKMLASDALNPPDIQATLTMLIEKLTILANGANKRGKMIEAGHYAEKCEHYQTRLNNTLEATA